MLFPCHFFLVSNEFQICSFLDADKAMVGNENEVFLRSSTTETKKINKAG